MKREILINGGQRETRVAILEDDRLVEILYDRQDKSRSVGDIYLGRVEAILPGIQASFVDVGKEIQPTILFFIDCASSNFKVEVMV